MPVESCWVLSHLLWSLVHSALISQPDPAQLSLGINEHLRVERALRREGRSQVVVIRIFCFARHTPVLTHSVK